MSVCKRLDIFKKIAKCFIVINLFWIVLSTVIPSHISNTDDINNQSLFQLNDESAISNLKLTNSQIYLIIAHPDDEVMFFSPSIIELNKPVYSNNIHFICFSNGNADGLGHIRSKELINSARIFGIPEENVHQIEDEINFRDAMNITWDNTKISATINKIITSNNKVASGQVVNLITFDELGVSDHPNHKSLLSGAKVYLEQHAANKNDQHLVQVFKLNSLSFFEKYSFTIITNVRLIEKYLRQLQTSCEYIKGTALDVPSVHWFADMLMSKFNKPEDESVIQIFSNLPSVILSLAAMSFAHDSQMVWFRWGWLLVSKFVNFNELHRVQV